MTKIIQQTESTMDSITSDKCAKELTNMSKEKIFITTKIKKHKNWTKEEDKLLIEIATKFKQKSWTKVALFFPDKNPAQCRARYKRIRPGIVKGPWKREEDVRIIELVQQTGKNWALISKMMPSRNGKQIRDRFLNYLDPHINKVKFTDDEDKLIIEQYKKHGSKWSVIAKSFPGRTGDMIKNRFYSCLKRRVHIYEVPQTKRNRKKYYKSKKDLFSSSNKNVSTSESPKQDICTIPYSYFSQVPNYSYSNKSEYQQEHLYDKQSNNSLPLISINISQNNNYKLNSALDHDGHNAENCICNHCNPTLPLTEKICPDNHLQNNIPVANFIRTPNYFENYYNDANFQNYLLYAQNQSLLQSNTPSYGSIQNMFPLNLSNNEQILASLYNLNNIAIQRNSNMQYK
jgi:hypothetical protein